MFDEANGNDLVAPSAAEQPGQILLTMSAKRPSAAQRLQKSLLPPSLLFFCQLAILVGIAASVIGYIGCFSLVQDNQSTATGRYLWLGLEILLSLLRTLMWASNPQFGGY